MKSRTREGSGGATDSASGKGSAGGVAEADGIAQRSATLAGILCGSAHEITFFLVRTQKQPMVCRNID
jgi:hypothetical protein